MITDILYARSMISSLQRMVECDSESDIDYDLGDLQLWSLDSATMSDDHQQAARSSNLSNPRNVKNVTHSLLLIPVQQLVLPRSSVRWSPIAVVTIGALFVCAVESLYLASKSWSAWCFIVSRSYQVAGTDVDKS